MKLKMITALLMFGTLTATAQGTSTSTTIKGHACVNPGLEERTEVIKEKSFSSATFKAGTLIEVAFMSVKEGKQKELNEGYFEKVMPIAMEYGLKPLMTVAIKSTHSKGIKPQMIGFFQWPNATLRTAFEKDPRFLKIKHIRTASLSFLKLGFFKVEKDMHVNLDTSLFYEIYGMDFNPETADQMGKYFEKAGPICVNDYGVDFALSMTPVSVKGFKKSYTAQSFGIAIWPSEDNNKNFFSSKAYANIKHYKENAVKTVDVWQGFVMLNN